VSALRGANVLARSEHTPWYEGPTLMEYLEDVDLYKLAANLIVDDVVDPDDLRAALIARFRAYSTRTSPRLDRKHGVLPV
jgi:sulfate adenylyltransferase subunit 1 (EFTu-like GTPase family)